MKTIFPKVITENFEFADYQETVDRLDYWLDERGYMSREDYRKGTVREYGFREERLIRDFPIRGEAVYLHLHVRRRKWHDTEDGSIFHLRLRAGGRRLYPDPRVRVFLKEED